MDSTAGKMIQKIFYFTRAIYALMCLVSIGIFLFFIPMHFSAGFSVNGLLRVAEAFIAALIGVTVFYLSHLACGAFREAQTDKIDALILKLLKIVRALYFTAFLDVIYFIETRGFNVVKRTPEEIMRDNPNLAYINEFKPVVMGLLDLMLVRPNGLAAILVALFISLWIKKMDQYAE